MDKGSKKEELISWIKYIIAALVISFILNNFIIINATIPTCSMEKTIMTGDRLWASRLSYLFEEPKRGDIVVFKWPDDEKKLLVKRIIGMPGDSVEIYGGAVYVNGEKLQEDYLNENMDTEGTWGVYEVPEDAYFVLGDNRNSSLDARYWNNTYVYRKNILGKPMLKYFPQIEWLGDK